MMFDTHKIVHIRGVDHPESLGVAPNGNVYTTGTGCQVYHVDITTNQATQVATTPSRVLGSAVDGNGHVYLGHLAGDVLKMTPNGELSTYATAPGGQKFMCPNYPAFDKQGNLYLSDSGTWARKVEGVIYKIPPGGGEAVRWYPQCVDTPNAIALDAEENFLYFVETFGNSISRIAIRDDGSAGEFERVVHMPRHIPDGIAIDGDGRVWIACHRPDAIYVYDPKTKRLELFCEDWSGEELRGPTDVAFAGPNRDILLASSLDNLVVHRFDGVDARGLPLNHPKIS